MAQQGLRPRKELVAAINEGGSVLIDGRIINKLDDLPSAAELAKLSGNPEEEQRVADELQERIAQLEAELGQLRSGGGGDATPQTESTASTVASATGSVGPETRSGNPVAFGTTVTDTGALPTDFPGRNELSAAGYTTLDSVSELTRDELDKIPGIGKATADKIIAETQKGGSR